MVFLKKEPFDIIFFDNKIAQFTINQQEVDMIFILMKLMSLLKIFSVI